MTWLGTTPRSSRDLTAAVAAILEARGYRVALEQDVGGVQLDILASRETDKGLVRTAFECKAFTKLVGLRSLRLWGTTVQYLREERQIEAGVLVTTSGFTVNAQRAGERFEIVLSTFADFADAESESPELVRELFTKWLGVRVYRGPGQQKRVFVVMPFDDPILDDVYLLGVRWVAQQLGVVVNRADDLEHNGEIIGEIQEALRTYDAVIADTTGANANVTYEVGYAHALKTPTILICRRGEKIPFDLQGVNHILYPRIVDLRPRLLSRLKATLKI